MLPFFTFSDCNSIPPEIWDKSRRNASTLMNENELSNFSGYPTRERLDSYGTKSRLTSDSRDELVLGPKRGKNWMAGCQVCTLFVCTSVR